MCDPIIKEGGDHSGMICKAKTKPEQTKKNSIINTNYFIGLSLGPREHPGQSKKRCLGTTMSCDTVQRETERKRKFVSRKGMES